MIGECFKVSGNRHNQSFYEHHDVVCVQSKLSVDMFGNHNSYVVVHPDGTAIGTAGVDYVEMLVEDGEWIPFTTLIALEVADVL